MLSWKYYVCFQENTTSAFMKNTADASSENTFDAHVKAGVGKCDQEEEHARLGEKREEWPAIVNLIISMSMSNVSSISMSIQYQMSPVTVSVL